MTLTLLQAETLLLKRCGNLLIAAGLDGVTVGGNGDLADPIGYAVRYLGGQVANPTALESSDLATISDIDALLDLAELRALKNFLGNYDAVDIKLGPRAEDFSDLRDATLKRVDSLEKSLTQSGILGFSSAETGVFTLDFAEHLEVE